MSRRTHLKSWELAGPSETDIMEHCGASPASPGPGAGTAAPWQPPLPGTGLLIRLLQNRELVLGRRSEERSDLLYSQRPPQSRKCLLLYWTFWREWLWKKLRPAFRWRALLFCWRRSRAGGGRLGNELAKSFTVLGVFVVFWNFCILVHGAKAIALCFCIKYAGLWLLFGSGFTV